MRRRKKKSQWDLLSTPPLKLAKFGTGEVAKILGEEMWRIQKFLSSVRYPLSPTGQLGRGKGSRRLFSIKEVYRIGIAAFLIRDGFAPKLVSQILERVEDEDLIDYDPQGEVHTGITLSRTGTGPKLGFFRSGNPPAITSGGKLYYALDLTEVTGDIDRRVQELEKGLRS